jgi:hypothetical protein
MGRALRGSGSIRGVQAGNTSRQSPENSFHGGIGLEMKVHTR